MARCKTPEQKQTVATCAVQFARDAAEAFREARSQSLDLADELTAARDTSAAAGPRMAALRRSMARLSDALEHAREGSELLRDVRAAKSLIVVGAVNRCPVCQKPAKRFELEVGGSRLLCLKCARRLDAGSRCGQPAEEAA